MTDDFIDDANDTSKYKGITGFVRLLFDSVVELIKFEYRASLEGNVYTKAQLQQLDPYDVEKAAAKMYQNLGYDTEVSKQGPDQGVDVLARNENGTVAIQVKRYQSGQLVSSPTIRRVIGAAQQVGADRAAVVTTTSFTEPAIETAHELDVELIDGGQFERLLYDPHDEPEPE